MAEQDEIHNHNGAAVDANRVPPVAFEQHDMDLHGADGAGDPALVNSPFEDEFDGSLHGLQRNGRVELDRLLLSLEQYGAGAPASDEFVSGALASNSSMVAGARDVLLGFQPARTDSMGLQPSGPDFPGFGTDPRVAEVQALINALPPSWNLASSPSGTNADVTSSASTLPAGLEPSASTRAAGLEGVFAAERNLADPGGFEGQPLTGDAFLDHIASEIAQANAEEGATTTRVGVPSETQAEAPDPALRSDELLVGEEDTGNADRLGAIASGAPTGAIASLSEDGKPAFEASSPAFKGSEVAEAVASTASPSPVAPSEATLGAADGTTTGAEISVEPAASSETSSTSQPPKALDGTVFARVLEPASAPEVQADAEPEPQAESSTSAEAQVVAPVESAGGDAPTAAAGSSELAARPPSQQHTDGSAEAPTTSAEGDLSAAPGTPEAAEAEQAPNAAVDPPSETVPGAPDQGAESSDQGAESSDQGAESSDQGAESSDQGAESSDQGAEESGAPAAEADQPAPPTSAASPVDAVGPIPEQPTDEATTSPDAAGDPYPPAPSGATEPAKAEQAPEEASAPAAETSSSDPTPAIAPVDAVGTTAHDPTGLPVGSLPTASGAEDTDPAPSPSLNSGTSAAFHPPVETDPLDPVAAGKASDGHGLATARQAGEPAAADASHGGLDVTREGIAASDSAELPYPAPGPGVPADMAEALLDILEPTVEAHADDAAATTTMQDELALLDPADDATDDRLGDTLAQDHAPADVLEDGPDDLDSGDDGDDA